MSAVSGGLQISWETLMQLPVPDRNIIMQRLDELKEQDFELMKRLHGAK
jgi:hypothetical protein